MKHRISLEPSCDCDRLSELTRQGDCVIICDCEGFELELLNPILVPELQRTDILVELHECIVPGVTTCIATRFACTHSIQIVKSEVPKIGSQPELQSLSRADQEHGLRERSVAMEWAWLQAKTL